MAKVLIINKFGKSKTNDMDYIPRIGDTIPIFYQPWPKVIKVIWFPEKALPELKGKHIDVIIKVD